MMRECTIIPVFDACETRCQSGGDDDEDDDGFVSHHRQEELIKVIV